MQMNAVMFRILYPLIRALIRCILVVCPFKNLWHAVLYRFGVSLLIYRFTHSYLNIAVTSICCPLSYSLVIGQTSSWNGTLVLGVLMPTLQFLIFNTKKIYDKYDKYFRKCNLFDSVSYKICIYDVHIKPILLCLLQ